MALFLAPSLLLKYDPRPMCPTNMDRGDWKPRKVAVPMEMSFWQVFKITFLTILIAELGDKTQLLTIKMAVRGQHRWAVFLGASLALITTSLVAILFGDLIARLLPEQCINHLFGVLFIVIGLLMFFGLF